MGRSKDLRVYLEAEDFEKLIKGEVLQIPKGKVTISVALADIGYPVMSKIIGDAWSKL